MARNQIKRIKEWRPSFGKSFNVMIEGHLEGDETKRLWRSSVIEHRDQPRILITIGGGKYQLVGSINEKACLERGFSKKLIDQFVDGFPDDWRDLLHTQYTILTHNLANFITTRKTDIDHDFDHFTPPKPTKKAKKETKAVVPYKTTANTVATTRSGRAVKPRVATWANQSIVYDNTGNVIEVRNPTTTTRQSKKVNQNLEKLCDVLGVDTPEASQISEKSVNTPKRRSTEKPKKKKQQKNNLVGYSDSEYDSIDELSSDGLELLETGDTPIRASKQVKKNLQKKNRILESSSEDEEKQVPIKVEKIRRKRTATTAPSTKNVPTKKGKKNEPISKGLSLKKAREQTVSPSLVDFDDHPIVEFPESDKENEKAPKKWTAKEKERFLELLKIMNPVNDFDWERLHENNKSDRTIEEMKEKAKELKWKPSRLAPREETNNQIDQITARPGTVAHIMQANQVNQNYLSAKNRNAASDDYVQQIRDANYAPLHINDSVMSMLRTPTNAKRQRNAFNPTFDIDLDGSSLNDSSMLNSPSSPSFIIPQDEQTRKRQQLYGLKVLKKTNTTTRKNGQNSTIFTETNTTTMNFLLPQMPAFKQSRFPRLEESADEEDDNDDDEEENELEDSQLNDDEQY
uniref:SANTA domain-containing protein n=1 Tax=Panagrolaimus sp. ES5 TaxID=591445 RepID=A0AC34GTP9_9BILA